MKKNANRNAVVFIKTFVTSGSGGLLLIVLLFSILMSLVAKNFLSTFNAFIVIRDVSTLILIGFSQMIVLALGHMNLSLGAIGGLVVVITGGLMEVYDVPIGAAVVIGLGIGVVAGLLNGIIITKSGINSFIVTLGTSSIFLGLNLGITQAQPFYNIPAAYKSFGQARWGFIPYMSVITVIVVIAMAVFIYRVVYGRHILALGSNPDATKTSGISVNRTICIAHAISGFLAAIAGLLWMSQLGSAQPMIGSTWALSSFAIPIIGGVALSGGNVSISGTIFAAFLIAIIGNALVHLEIDPYYVQFLLGLLILGAVGLNRLAQRNR